MNVISIAVIAAFVLLEKTLPYARYAAWFVGGAMVLTGMEQ